MDPSPSPIQRFSSRRQRLDSSFLATRLKGAKAYDRIAGYFSSSILEVAGEALETVQGKVRMVCNSGLHPRDVETARAAQAAMRSSSGRTAPRYWTRGPRLIARGRAGADLWATHWGVPRYAPD
jgi:hypothetical protein